MSSLLNIILILAIGYYLVLLRSSLSKWHPKNLAQVLFYIDLIIFHILYLVTNIDLFYLVSVFLVGIPFLLLVLALIIEKKYTH